MRDSSGPADDENKRDTERLTILGELHGEVMVFQPMAIKEIGRGGAQIETQLPLQLNSLHELRLTLGDHSIIVKGRIVYCGISDVDQELVTYRTGIEFVEASERVRDVITGFIDSIRSRRNPA
jgi:hypothetical protein